MDTIGKEILLDLIGDEAEGSELLGELLLSTITEVVRLSIDLIGGLTSLEVTDVLMVCSEGRMISFFTILSLSSSSLVFVMFSCIEEVVDVGPVLPVEMG